MPVKIKIFIVLVALAHFCLAQIPVLNSSPSISDKVIYLDFDGQVVSATGWDSGNTINALPSTMSAANIVLIFKRVSEDYRPFDVNITTDSVRFNNAPANQRMRVVITPSSAWYGASAGGVAFVGSFTWGGTPGTPCWIFEDMLGYSPKNIAEASAHEAGHTLTLKHQSTYSAATCSKTAEYNPGLGNGVTSWAPIMGVGYSKNVTTWYNGKSSLGCNIIQNDHSNSGTGITSPGYLNFLADDIGNTAATAKILNLSSVNLLDSGLITTPADIDAYMFSICSNRYVTLDIKPWALDTTNYSGADLDIRLYLYNAANNQLAVDTPLAKLNSRIGMNLTPGTYWFTVDGGRSANYSDYGSLGKYYVRVKATNPPAFSNTIVLDGNICSGQSTTLTYTSGGAPTQWSWVISGATTATYTSQNPNLVFNTGTNTISLIASDALSPGCAVIATLNVNPPPIISITNPTNALCFGNNLNLIAGGASSYTWLPGAFTGTSLQVAPLMNTTYTLIGVNGSCSNSAVTTVTVSPNFTVFATASASSICSGESVTITATGASSYTINPGSINTSSFTTYLSSTTQFFVTGKNSNCSKAASVTVTVDPHFDLSISASATGFCAGESITMIGSGATDYTFNPGNITNNLAIVNPSATTIYTLTARSGGNSCVEDTTITLTLKDCNALGVPQIGGSNTGIRIYPNPSHAFLMVETGIENTTVQITNALGQVVAIQKINSKQVQIITSPWPRGIYTVTAFSENKIYYSQKIILE